MGGVRRVGAGRVRAADTALGRLLAASTAVLVAATVAFVPAPARAERTIALSSGTFELSLAPNQSSSDRVMVANNGDEQINALVYTADVEADEEGNQTYTRPSPSPQDYLDSPASWVRIQVPDTTKIVANTPYLDMEPGQEFPVDFEVVVPSGAAPGDYNIVVFFEMFSFDQGSEGAVSRVSGRIGTRIDLRVVGDVTDDLRVQDLVARNLVIGDTTPFSVRVRNAGNIDKKFALELVLVGSGETVVWSQALEEEANVYAGKERLYDGALGFDGVGFGSYELRAVMDYDREIGDGEGSVTPETLTVERGIWIVPLWLAIVVIVVVGLPLIYLSYRLSTRRRREEARGESQAPAAPDAADQSERVRDASAEVASVAVAHEQEPADRSDTRAGRKAFAGRSRRSRSDAEERRRAREARRAEREGRGEE